MRQLTLTDLLGQPVIIAGLMDDAYCPNCKRGFLWWETDQDCPLCGTRVNWERWHLANDEENEMSWVHRNREITKEQYQAIKGDRMQEDDFFTEAELQGYGATPLDTYEKDGKYYIYYGINTSCD